MSRLLSRLVLNSTWFYYYRHPFLVTPEKISRQRLVTVRKSRFWHELWHGYLCLPLSLLYLSTCLCGLPSIHLLSGSLSTLLAANKRRAMPKISGPFSITLLASVTSPSLSFFLSSLFLVSSHSLISKPDLTVQQRALTDMHPKRDVCICLLRVHHNLCSHLSILKLIVFVRWSSVYCKTSPSCMMWEVG